MFVLETIDKQVLEDPQSHIIDKSGKIWFAEHPRLGIVGTCAFWNKGDNNFELTKMGVLKSARGRKVGEIMGKTTHGAMWLCCIPLPTQNDGSSY